MVVGLWGYEVIEFYGYMVMRFMVIGFIYFIILLPCKRVRIAR